MEHPPSRLLLRKRPNHQGAALLAERVTNFLKDKKIEVVECDDFTEINLKKFDFAIAIGGDGTLLRLFHKIKGNIPILGIKDGSYGLLMELSEENLTEGLNKLIMGKFWIEEATTIEIPKTKILALNEILLSTPKIGKALKIRVSVDGTIVNGFLGDGLLISTPLGSLAYALSEGGSSIDPRANVLEIVPVNPWPPSMLVPTSSTIIPMDSSLLIEADKTMLAVPDGCIEECVLLDRRIKIRTSREKAKLIRFSTSPHHHYSRIIKRISEAKKVAEKRFLKEGLLS